MGMDRKPHKQLIEVWVLTPWKILKERRRTRHSTRWSTKGQGLANRFSWCLTFSLLHHSINRKEQEVKYSCFKEVFFFNTLIGIQKPRCLGHYLSASNNINLYQSQRHGLQEQAVYTNTKFIFSWTLMPINKTLQISLDTIKMKYNIYVEGCYAHKNLKSNLDEQLWTNSCGMEEELVEFSFCLVGWLVVVFFSFHKILKLKAFLCTDYS